MKYTIKCIMRLIDCLFGENKRAAIEENNEESRSPASVLNLPLDCVGIILDLLTQQDILAFRATCRKASSLVATRRNTWHVRRFDNDPRFVVLGHVVCGLRELHLDVYAPSPIQASPPLAIQPYTPVHASSHTHTHMHVLPRGQDSAEVDSNITQEHTRLSTYMHTSIPTHLSTNITMSDDACTCGIDNESGLRNGSANVGTCDNARSTQIRRDRHVHGLTNINLRKRDNMIGNCIGANVNDWAINGLGLYYLPRLLQSLSTLSLSGPMAVVGQYLEMFITHRHSRMSISRLYLHCDQARDKQRPLVYSHPVPDIDTQLHTHMRANTHSDTHTNAHYAAHESACYQSSFPEHPQPCSPSQYQSSLTHLCTTAHNVVDLNDDDDDIRAHSDTHSRIYEYCNSNTHDPFPTTTHKSHRRPPCWGSEPPDITLSRLVIVTASLPLLTHLSLTGCRSIQPIKFADLCVLTSALTHLEVLTLGYMETDWNESTHVCMCEVENENANMTHALKGTRMRTSSRTHDECTSIHARCLTKLRKLTFRVSKPVSPGLPGSIYKLLGSVCSNAESKCIKCEGIIRCVGDLKTSPVGVFQSLIVDSDYLDLGEVETIFALPAITRLGLVNSQISDRILTIYLPSVGPKLTHLDLAWCGALTEAGLRALTPTATPNLTHLDLSGVATNTETLISLCALPRLQSLKLESCLYITDESAWILSMFPSLSHLSLMMCVRLTDRGIRNLSGSVSLTSVDLSFTHVSHVGVCYLAKNAPCIRTIKLQGCSSIPKAARVHFLNIPSSCKQ